MSGHTFRVPASTSNLGAGFDALSLALQMYLDVEVREAQQTGIVTRGVSVESIPLGPDNLILRVAQRTAELRGRILPALELMINNDIPLARGLGSSAAAIVAGVTCYELICGDRLSEDDFFRCAMEFEPHPDNLAAALHGGLISAATSAAGDVFVSRLDVAQGVTPLVVIPEFELSTAKARDVLPDTYSRADTVFNVQRSALTIAALTNGQWSLLREAMRDRMHQPFRSPLIPGLDEVLALDAPGLHGIALSGAGPTVFALTAAGRAESVGASIVSIFAKHGIAAAARKVKIDKKGRTVAEA